MSPYDEDPMPAEPDVDPRVVAMQRVVDLEQQHQWAVRDADERQQKAAIIGEELSVARDELHGLLGLPSKSNVRAMSGAEARRLVDGLEGMGR